MTENVAARPPFRDGSDYGGIAPQALAGPQFTGPQVLLADVSEFQPAIADAVYLKWSQAMAIRAMYGDAHEDRAWYGGARRASLHAGGVRVLFIYQYLVSGQSGAAQAQAFRDLVGAIRPGEVFVADFEEGAKPELSAWYGKMLALYGQAIRPYLWTYSGLWFGKSQGVLPVEWIAAYQSAEPSTPHRLWQFTASYQVPGVGVADCNVFHGTIDELAALAYQPSKPVPPPPPSPQLPTLEEIVTAAPTVKQGDTGQAVSNWQGLLRARGYNLGTTGPGRDGIDGSFGTATEKATRAFQQAHKLTADGIAGALTLKAALAA